MSLLKRLIQRAQFALVGIALLVPGRGVADAQDANFTAQYALSEVLQSTDDVIVTLTLGLRNDTDAYALNTRISIERPDAPEDTDDFAPELRFGAFERLDIRPRETVRLSRQFALPISEYYRWRQGESPCIRISFDDAETSIRHRFTLSVNEAPAIPFYPNVF